MTQVGTTNKPYPPAPTDPYTPANPDQPPPGYQPPPAGYQPPPPGYQPLPPGYQQPPPGYQPGPQTSTMVVVTQPGLGYGPQPGGTCRYHAAPCLVQCQFCNATVTTSTHYTVGTYAFVVAGIILFLGFWLGCCLIPFCLDGCKDVVHTCPNCRCVVGRYSRM